MPEEKPKKNFKIHIELFHFVRDIPYHISTHGEQDFSCATKPIILDRLFQTCGLKSRHIIVEFLWSKLKLPKQLLQIPHEDLETHEYLEVFIPEKREWVIVDATWDSTIKNPSFPISEWDGLSDTKIAVPVEKTYTPEASLSYIRGWSEADTKKQLEKNGKFYEAFNNWLETQRVRL